ncbi:MAG: hypothetical protein DWI02_03265 [Planctomycetota bacterium]|nr:MAG: hypothetical protein DWI02_03265 [Planctomycetota bacterium]
MIAVSDISNEEGAGIGTTEIVPLDETVVIASMDSELTTVIAFLEPSYNDELARFSEILKTSSHVFVVPGAEY